MQDHDRAERYRSALEALGQHDLEGMARHYRHDVDARDHAQQRSITGIEEYRAWCTEWLDAFPDSRIEDLECVGAGTWTVARFASTGTNDGALGPFEPTGRAMRAELCAIARWEGDRVAEEHIYYDMYGVLAQLGHVPAPTSAG